MRIRLAMRRFMTRASVVAATAVAVLVAAPGMANAAPSQTPSGDCIGETSAYLGSPSAFGQGRTFCTRAYYHLRSVSYWERYGANGVWQVRATSLPADIYNAAATAYSRVSFPYASCTGVPGYWRVRTRHVRQLTSTAAVIRWDSASPAYLATC